MLATKKTNIVLHIVFMLLVVVMLFPIILTVSISLSSSKSIIEYGYNIIPKEFSVEAYKFIFEDSSTILRAYAVTIFTTVVGTGLSTLVIMLYAYTLSRRDFKFRKFLTYFTLFTMLFSGGTVSSYIVNTTVYKLSNTVWAMILPYVVSAWYIIVMRTFFRSSVPVSIIESGKLDGAGEFRIFFKLVVPISIPGVATVALFQTLYYWNDWWLPMLYIVEPKLYNLQFLLQQMMQNIQNLNENSRFISNASEQLMNMPTESARMALCMVAMGPILIVYPFFQKYFIQGLTVGAVKG